MKTDSIFGEVIYAYTRAQAIADGVLIDVTTDAREAGLRFPVAVTRAVWDRYVEIPDGIVGQDDRGRLWDIVWMLRVAIARGSGGDRCDFHVYVRNHNRLKLTRRDLVKLKAICGPGDQAEPVITIMLPDED